jgi:hypothetical protein
MRFLPATLLLLLAVLVPAPGANAAAGVEESEDLWATVNVCDSAARPDRIGIRASMPGLRSRTRMQMRFRVQYLSGAGGEWRDVASGADSGWRTVGRARGRVLEAGQDFTFPPPEGGGTHTLRGVVTFRWRRQKRTIKRIREVTEAGHASTRGADPPGYSAATCDIS